MNTENDRRLDTALAKLPRAVEPPHDLWPGIAARIAEHGPKSATRNWGYGLAAAATMVIAVAVIWTTSITHTAVPGRNIATIVPAGGSAGAPDLQMQFSAQLASDTNLPVPARRAFVGNLQLLRDAIMRAQAEIKKYPDDVNLRSLLLDLYQQEARLMNEAQQAQIQTSVRTSI